ncbi:MAG TPA: hypothetical protein VIR14_05300 [Gaiellaceae bacterium]
MPRSWSSPAGGTCASSSLAGAWWGPRACIARGGEWRTNAALGAQVERVEPPSIARALALSAARAARADLVGVDLLPTGNGFVVLELNGAVDFRRAYAPGRNVFADAVAALIGDTAREPLLAAASA